jgi:hypothetical protein
VAHEVAAGDVAVDAAGRADPVHRAREVRAAGDERPRHDPLPHDLAPVVDVVDEVVERADPLREPALDVAPLLAAQHARDEVERERALARVAGALLARRLERDPLLQEGGVAPAAGLRQPVGADPLQLGDERGGRAARDAVGLEQLVVEGRFRAVGVDRWHGRLRRHRAVDPRARRCVRHSPDGARSAMRARHAVRRWAR